MPTATEASANRSGAPSGSDLDVAFRRWSSEPLLLHLAAVLLLVSILAARYAPIVLAPEPINDETIYFDAFAATARGGSPFSVSGYLSLSLLAYLGGWCLQAVGPLVTLAALRFVNLMGVAATAWCALAWTPWPWRRRLLVAALYLVLAPAVSFGIFVGNLSLAVAGAIVVSLLVWRRRPLTAGLLLGASVVAKPVAPGAIVALLFHRSSAADRRHWLAGGVAATLTVALVVASPRLGEALAIDPLPRLARSVSPHRLLSLLDLGWPAVALSAVIALGIAALARRRRLTPLELLALATTAAIATTPLVWPHTLLVALPLEVVCLQLVWRRWRDRHDRLELVLVCLAVAALQLAEGATDIYDQAAWIQWLGSLPPMLAPAALTAYLWRVAGLSGPTPARESRESAA